MPCGTFSYACLSHPNDMKTQCKLTEGGQGCLLTDIALLDYIKSVDTCSRARVDEKLWVTDKPCR